MLPTSNTVGHSIGFITLSLLSSVSMLKLILARRGYALGIPRHCHQATKYLLKTRTDKYNSCAYFPLDQQRVILPD